MTTPVPHPASPPMRVVERGDEGTRVCVLNRTSRK
jgi:hypothetical protein